MKYYKYIFVVLVYKNIDVLEDFFKNIPLYNYHIIVVNSYFDEVSLQKCKETSELNNASFISIPNRGYGYGNNYGIQYAINHFTFDFLIVSNSDIEIQEWSDIDYLKGKPVVIAPNIKAISQNNKPQNPNIVSFSKTFYYDLLKRGYQKRNVLFQKFAHAYSRVTRELYLRLSCYRFIKRNNIFSAHGSFIIFTEASVKILSPVFNDEMFLYNEELYLALRCKQLGVNITYCHNIKILHFEGASSSSVNSDESLKSFSILENYIERNNLL